MREIVKEIKNRLFKYLSDIRSDRDLMGKLYVITLATAFLILAVVVKGPDQIGYVIYDEDGNATSIERYSLEKGEKYSFEVSVLDEENTIDKEVDVRLKAIEGENESDVKDELIGRETELEVALDGAIRDIEMSGERKIKLPDELSDGTGLRWKEKKEKDYSTLIMIPVIYAALITFVIRNSKEPDAMEADLKRTSILKALPRFCNQLLLMMNAGLILSDAFERIAESYESSAVPEGVDSKTYSGYFEKELYEMHMKNPDHRKSTAVMLNEFAVKNDVKEMIRITTILTENEKRGSDVIESLSRESRYLWDERKIVAREKGKMIDTKMSYPLGILLILLIVITMAPAMLNM